MGHGKAWRRLSDVHARIPRHLWVCVRYACTCMICRVRRWIKRSPDKKRVAAKDHAFIGKSAFQGRIQRVQDPPKVHRSFQDSKAYELP